MTVKLLTKHHLEFLSLKKGCTGSSESTFVKIPNCWKSHVTALMLMLHFCQYSTNQTIHTYIKLHVNGLEAIKQYTLT